MKIMIRLFATFREFAPVGSANTAFSVEADANETVQEILNTLRLPAEFPRVILVNGYQVSEHTVLCAGDTVSVFPPLIGGR